MSRNRTFGAIGGPAGIAKKFTAANFNLTPEWDIASVDSTTAPVTIGLPQPGDQYPPSDGEIYSVVDSGGAAAANAITVSSPGIPIRLPNAARGASAVISSGGGSLTFLYEAAEGEYSLLSSNGITSGGPPTRPVFSAANVYINALAGDDANDGLTPETAWKTNARFGAAIGVYGLITVPGSGPRWCTVNYLGAIPTDLMSLQAVLDRNVCLKFSGTALVTTLHSGTISAAVPYSDSNVLASITDPDVSSWAPYAKQRITWTGGAAIGAKAFIALDLGSNTARVSGPAILFDVVETGISVPTAVAPSTGTYTIDGLATLYMGTCDIQSTNNGNAIEPFVWWVDLEIADTSSVGANTNPTCLPTFYQANGCIVTWRELEGLGFAGAVCCFPTGIIVNYAADVNLAACLVFDYCLFTDGANGGMSLWTLAEGCGITAISGAYLAIADVAVENAAANFANQMGDGISTQVSYTGSGFIQFVANTGIVGSGNAGVGIRVPNGGSFPSRIVPKITGTGGDLALGAATTAFAWDDTAGQYVTPKRALTWSNVAASVASGGFGGQPQNVREQSFFLGPQS